MLLNASLKSQRTKAHKGVKTLTSLWKKSRQYHTLSFREKCLFYGLCFLEYGYRAGFSFAQSRSRKKTPHVAPFKIISVGNISVGGTGKSVVTQFLISHLSSHKGAVILRGYRGANERTNESLLVSDGTNILTDVKTAGDEACMHARMLSVPIVVGRRRTCSCMLLTQWVESAKQDIDYVVLDDAYQNHAVKKDLEILLLDARAPFENGHCLPAGGLREKDITRADIIICSHADKLDVQERQALRQELISKGGSKEICMGEHVGVLNTVEGESVSDMSGKKSLLVAGIGSFDGFISGAKKLGLSIGAAIEFADHYSYSADDITHIQNQAEQQGCEIIVTTRKDWIKMAPLLAANLADKTLPFYVIDVTFDFVLPQERARFLSMVSALLNG